MSSNKKRILFVLPNRFAGRNILESSIPDIMAQHADVHVTFVSLFADDEAKVAGFGASNLDWKSLKNPVSEKKVRAGHGMKYMVMNLVYRFLHLYCLAGRVMTPCFTVFIS